MKITEVSVTSRRSVKIGSDFLTFECMLEASLEDKDNQDGCLKSLWDKANGQVDGQIEDAVKSLGG